MPIKDLSNRRRIPRLGKIHLGVRDPVKGYPIRTDYFVCPPEVCEVFGEQPKALDILIPVEDEEKWASQFYRCYSLTRGLICKGDGETASRMATKGTTELPDAGTKEVEMIDFECKGRDCPDYKVRCKEVMNVQFLLPKVKGLGIYQIDTSSINSIININSCVELIRNIYGKIAMIPLSLTLEPKKVNNPETGKKMEVYVLNLRWNGTMSELALAARRQAAEFLLPCGDDERPDLVSPEWELTPVEMPANDKPLTEKEVDSLFPAGGSEPAIKANGGPKELAPVKVEATPAPAKERKPKAAKVKPADVVYTDIEAVKAKTLNKPTQASVAAAPPLTDADFIDPVVPPPSANALQRASPQQINALERLRDAGKRLIEYIAKHPEWGTIEKLTDLTYLQAEKLITECQTKQK
jgi:hypothetical protein